MHQIQRRLAPLLVGDIDSGIEGSDKDSGQ